MNLVGITYGGYGQLMSGYLNLKYIYVSHSLLATVSCPSVPGEGRVSGVLAMLYDGRLVDLLCVITDAEGPRGSCLEDSILQ